MKPQSEQQLIKSFGKKLPPAFYERADVVIIAWELLGKILVTHIDYQLTAGRITETEAYNGAFDKASHAFGNRRTKRTEVMYGSGGTAYIYLCYGLHQMFNVVTNISDIPNAVLIREIEPVAGNDVMLQRLKKTIHKPGLTKGPGNVGKALGIHTAQSGMSLQSNELFIADDGFSFSTNEIAITKRIGVDYAAEDALLPYRFVVER